MTTIHTRRAQVLAEAIVSNYISELSPRERPARPDHERERTLARVVRPRRDRERSRRRPELVTA